MKRLGLVVALFSLLATCGSASASESASTSKVPHSFYGIVPNTDLNANDYVLMKAAGVGSLRFGMYWSSIKPYADAPPNFAAFDSTVAAASNSGIGLLPVVNGTPAYEAGGCSTTECSRKVPTSPAALADWTQFLQAAVARYGTHGTFWAQYPYVTYHPITLWQLYNEQNNGNTGNPAKAYAKFVKVSDAAIKAVDPSGEVLLGGMFGAPPSGGKSLAWNYLKDLYKSGAKGHFAGVALHPYAPKIPGIAKQIEKIRKVMKANHDKSTPTYVTEIGWGSSKKKHPGTGGRGALFNVGVKKQTENLKASFKLLLDNRSTWKIGGVYWFTWKDPANPPPGLCAFCYSAGLYKANGTTAKPALGAFKAFTKKAAR